MADCSDRTGSPVKFRSLAESGSPAGVGLAGQWLGQSAVHWAAKNILLFSLLSKGTTQGTGRSMHPRSGQKYYLYYVILLLLLLWLSKLILK